MKIVLPLLACLCLLSRPILAQDLASGARSHTQIDQYNLTWNVPGPSSAASMPLGNGDIGLNVWVEPGGDLLSYISKTDAWGGEKDSTADTWMQEGGVLMKLGLIRVSLTPKPMVSSFSQTLHLGHGEITIRLGEGATAIDYRIWVDANHPVIRIEANGSQPFKTTVTVHDWRLQQGDTILTAPRADASNAPAPHAALTWFHHNPAMTDPRLADPPPRRHHLRRHPHRAGS